MAGAAQGTGAADTDADAVRESWIHVELGQVEDERGWPPTCAASLTTCGSRWRTSGGCAAPPASLSRLLTDDGGPEEAEASELLAWLSAGHFTFLGYRKYDLGRGDGRGAEARARYRTRHPPPRRRRRRSPSPRPDRAGKHRARLLVLAKSSTRSTVYRPSYLDYVAVRRFSQETGEVTGEYRFLGLYTQAAYTESITRIPVLRRKLDRVLAIAGLPADSHDGKALIEILEGYPREELFEISAEQLAPIALAVLGLGERKQVRLFLRPDAYGRYVSCLVYLPRDRYTTQVRLRAQEILRGAFGGASVDYSAMVGNSALARLHVVVHGAPGQPLATVDQAELQARIAAAVRSWDEDLAAEAERQLGPERAAAVLRTCADGIPETYKADTTPAEAVEDLAVVLRLREESPRSPSGSRSARTNRGGCGSSGFPDHVVRRAAQLQHMGLEVLDEHPYEFGGTTRPFWIYDFGPRADPERAADRGGGRPRRAGFESALAALWRGRPRMTSSTAWYSTRG